MQSGEGRTKQWVLEFAPASPREIEPLMGWTGTRDMRAQVQLAFATKEEAVAYAEREGIAYQVFEPAPRCATAATPISRATSSPAPAP